MNTKKDIDNFKNELKSHKNYLKITKNPKIKNKKLVVQVRYVIETQFKLGKHRLQFSKKRCKSHHPTCQYQLIFEQ